MPIFRAEARRLLSQPRRCGDWTGWVAPGRGAAALWSGAGVMDMQGKATPFYVELLCRKNAKNKRRNYCFTLYRRNGFGVARVYQLSVGMQAASAKDLHKRAHEHIGDARLLGAVEWDDWAFEKAFSYFCERANLHPDTLPLNPDFIPWRTP